MSSDNGRLSDNIVHFARLLRRLGLPIGPAETVAAGQALAHVDLGARGEVKAALRASMVHRHDHHDLFDQAFALFGKICMSRLFQQSP